MPTVTKQIREGAHYRFTIYAVAERSDSGLRCPTLDFFQDAETKEPEDLERLTAILDYLAEHGSLRNENKFKHVTNTNGIFEMRTPRGLRLFCFFDEGRVIVCTNGVIKKRQKAQPDDISSAEQWKAAYSKAQLLGELIHEPEHES